MIFGGTGSEFKDRYRDTCLYSPTQRLGREEHEFETSLDNRVVHLS